MSDRRSLNSTAALSLLLCIVIVISAFSFVGNGSRQNAFDASELSATYVIFKDQNMVMAKNGTTGEIDFESDNATYVFQSVVDHVESTGGLIHVKPGVYEIAAQIDITSRCVIQGEGYSNIGTGTILRAVRDNITMFHIQSMGEWGFGMRSIMLNGANNGSVGISVDYLNRANFYDVMVYHWKDYGMILNNATALNFNGCKFMKNGVSSAETGGVLLGDPGYAIGITFDSCQFDWCGVGATLKNTSSVTFRSCIVENCLYSGIRGLSNPSEKWWAQQIYILESYFEDNNVIRTTNQRDISIEGQSCSFWTISNCVFIGNKVNHSIRAGWMTGPINIENPRIYGSPIYYIAGTGYLLGVVESHLDPACLPLKPGVTGFSQDLFSTEDHGSYVFAPGQTVACIEHSLGSTPSSVIVTSGSGGKANGAWVDETATNDTVIVIHLPEPHDTSVTLYWAAYK